jgi:molecular chaperone HtpG
MPRMQAAIPPRLRTLSEKSAGVGAFLAFTECCDQVLADNKMPFFPAYTDHGTSHVESMLKASERLIPDSVWEKELLGGDDAIVLTAASFLHDLALHLREPGFLALIEEGSRYKPVPWFNEDQRGRPADAPWSVLWQDFRREARRFSQSQLDRLLGPGHGDPPQIILGEPDTDPSEWTLNDRLLIGEFLRRHHARLAHEIAIYGFPGIAEKEFPMLRKSLPRLAEAIGATARSHNEDMRVVSDYLDSRSKGDLRPDGVAQLYLMGVLRIADYFQLEPTRATPLLLHLREPQSPASVAEWKKHQAVSSISWEHKDPHAVSIQISSSHSLRTHLQLTELLADLQSELDLAAAVLSETYGGTKLSPLQLSLQRVRTNLHEPEMHARLSFVPQPSHLRSAEDLFRLMVGDLYGNEPTVAGRELLQNAVDAVRERKRWEDIRSEQIENDRFRALPADIVVEVEEVDEAEGLLRVSDRGIGMSPSTVTESFLTAGATFAPSSVDLESQESGSRIEWLKAGRFGVGVFAAFLLGSEIQVTTRHLQAERGIRFTARLDDDLVQLDWDEEAPLGTEIVVPYSARRLVPRGYHPREDDFAASHLELLHGVALFFGLIEPRVEFLIKRRHGTTERLDNVREIPSPSSRLPDQWRKVQTSQFDAVLWSLPSREIELGVFAPWNGYATNLAHNGFLIRKPDRAFDNLVYEWSGYKANEIVGTPSIAIFDTKQNLKIALNRYELADSKLPFEKELLKSIGADVVAHALTQGEEQYPLDKAWGLKPVVSRSHWIPLIPQLIERHVRGDLCVLLISEPARREITTRFLKGRTAGGRWRELPFRTAVAPHEAFASELELEEVEMDELLWKSHAEKEALYSIENSVSLGRFPLAGVLSRRFAKVTPLFGDSDDEDPDVERFNKLLTEVAEELRKGEDPDFFALVLLREFDEPGLPGEEPLALAWEEAIGGLLERSPKARERRLREIGEKKKPLRALANKWKRFASRPSQLD